MSSDPQSAAPTGNLDLSSKPSAAEGTVPEPQYFAALKYFFEHPDWGMTLLLGSLCLLIPVINSMIMFGYRYEIVEMKIRFPDQLYPKFDFNRFSQYLMRGIWPFLIDFIVQFIINIPFQLSVWMMIGLANVAGASESQALIVLTIVVIPCVTLLLILFLIALHIVLVPITLRAGLAQDFGLALNFAWIKDFLRKMWLQTLLFNLFLLAIGSVLFIAGYMACCIGIIPVAFFLMVPVLAHYHEQLYRMYLAKGGEPIPLKPLQMEPVFSTSAPGFMPPKPPPM